MNDSNEIRESLMKIKQSQAELLRQLRSEHDALQGYLNTNEIPYGSSYRNSMLNNRHEYMSYQSSLQLSKSQGNPPHHTKQVLYRSTTAGAQDILENNYKKIEQLLMKQRKMYQQNHALQQQNQSLLEDYRQLKKLLYEVKQTNRDNLIIMNYLLTQIVYPSIRDLLLEVSNNEIAERSKKNWNRFKIQHPKLFNLSESSEHFNEQSQKFIQKMLSLLDQDFKVNTIKTKQQQIEELKQKITQLVNMNDQVTKNKQQLILNEQKRHTSLQVENSKLSEKVKQLELKFLQCRGENLNKLKQLETEIIQKCKEMERISRGLMEKDEEIQMYKEKLNQMSVQGKNSYEEIQQFKQQINNLKSKLKQKEQMFQNQIELNKKQNSLVERMSRDILELRNHIEGSAQRRGQLQSKLWLENEGLVKQLTALKQDYEKYRQYAQKQINSLVTHNKQIKAQHNLLIKSQQTNRINEMRYRDLIAVKQTNMKLSTNVDHLWSIKQIQYDNIMVALQKFK